MAHFELTDGTPISKITIHVGNTVTLNQVGGGHGKALVEIDTTDSNSVEIKNKSRLGSTQRFDLHGKNANTTPIKITATTELPKEDGKTIEVVPYSVPLEVRVGIIKNHTGMEVDLLAELIGRSNDAKKNLIYQMILDGDYNGFRGDMFKFHPYNQEGLKPDGSPKRQGDALRCGTEMEEFGASFMGGASLNYYPIHKPRPDLANKGTVSRTVLQYDSGTLDRAVTAIKNLLKKKKPVRVVVVDQPNITFAYNGAINNQHFVMIVGFGGDSFLYIDPWPTGSKLKYLGGIDGNYQTMFMGIFKYETGKGILQDTALCGGAFGGNGFESNFLEVVSGPAF